MRTVRSVSPALLKQLVLFFVGVGAIRPEEDFGDSAKDASPQKSAEINCDEVLAKFNANPPDDTGRKEEHSILKGFTEFVKGIWVLRKGKVKAEDGGGEEETITLPRVEVKPVYDRSVFQAVEELFKVRYKADLGIGRDCSDYLRLEPYDGLRLVAVWSVNNPITRGAYQQERDAIRNDDKFSCKVAGEHCAEAETNYQDDIPGVPRAEELNEKYFLHGTKPPFVLPILCTGLNRGGGLFGDGVYLADRIEKMDQYTEPEPPSIRREGNGIMQKFNHTDYAAALDEDLFFGFIVSGVLGRSLPVFGADYSANIETLDGGTLKLKAAKKSFKNSFKKSVSKYFSRKKRSDRLQMEAEYPKDSPTKDATGLYHSWIGYATRNKGQSQVWRFNEFIVPIDSHRQNIEFVAAYKRCSSYRVNTPSPTPRPPRPPPPSRPMLIAGLHAVYQWWTGNTEPHWLVQKLHDTYTNYQNGGTTTTTTTTTSASTTETRTLDWCVGTSLER